MSLDGPSILLWAQVGSSHGPCPLGVETLSLSGGGIPTLKVEYPCSNNGLGLGYCATNPPHNGDEGALVLYKKEPRGCQYDGIYHPWTLPFTK